MKTILKKILFVISAIAGAILLLAIILFGIWGLVFSEECHDKEVRKQVIVELGNPLDRMDVQDEVARRICNAEDNNCYLEAIQKLSRPTSSTPPSTTAHSWSNITSHFNHM